MCLVVAALSVDVRDFAPATLYERASRPVLAAGRGQNAPQPSLAPFPSTMPVLAPDGQATTFQRLAQDHGDSGVLVVRLQALWCGTCRWHGQATARWMATPPPAFQLVDVIIADGDNAPATPGDAREWQGLAGTSGATVVADPAAFASYFTNPAPLPRILIVDARSWVVRATLANPTLEALDRALGRPADPTAAARTDERFSADQWALIQQMRLPDRWPADPSNRVADSPAAAALGAALFEETGLAPSRRSCVSCHMPDMLFTNGKDVAGEGIGPGKRNVPTVLLSGHARSLNWDGGADSSWAQAILPFEDADEMGSSRLYVAHGVHERQRRGYEAVFGPMPPLSDATRFPSQGRPGTPEWQRMTEADRLAVNVVFANVGKALAAYQRSLRVAPTALDRYASGDHTALSPAQKDGLLAFMRAGCAQCHHGPRLTDDAFHNLRFPTGRPDRQPDPGRADGIAHLLANEFRRDSLFSDARTALNAPREGPHAVGAFRTPSLRGVPFTMPYGHGGGFGGLISVVDAHRTGGLPVSSRYATGAAEPWQQGFDRALIGSITAFLQVLRADVSATK